MKKMDIYDWLIIAGIAVVTLSIIIGYHLYVISLIELSIW